MLWDEPKIFFLERRYFFSIILSEFLKNRVALQAASIMSAMSILVSSAGVLLAIGIITAAPVMGIASCPSLFSRF